MNFPKFCLFTFIGSVPWNTALVFIGYLLKENWSILEKYSPYIDILAVFMVAAVIYYLVRRIRFSTRSG
jgi:membrane protein DedA with SNARE-associated domain